MNNPDQLGGHPRHQWNKGDDAIIIGMRNAGRTEVEIAQRFSTTALDVQCRLAYLDEVNTAAKGGDAPNIETGRIADATISDRPAGLAAPAPVAPEEDALEGVFTDLCRDYSELGPALPVLVSRYNQMGEELKFFSELISRRLNAEGMVVEMTRLYSLWESIITAKPPFHVWVGPRLLDRCAVLPKPMIQRTKPSAVAPLQG